MSMDPQDNKFHNKGINNCIEILKRHAKIGGGE